MFLFVLDLKLAYMLFEMTDNLSNALQSTDLAACDGIELANVVVDALRKKRSAEEFALFYSETCKEAHDLGMISSMHVHMQRVCDCWCISLSAFPKVASTHIYR